MRVLLIIGGQSTENEVSRMSAQNIYKNIDKKHDVKVLGISKDGIWYELKNMIFTSDNWLEDASIVKDTLTYIRTFDVAFPILHGKFGEDGTIQGLLELAGISYVGMNVMSSSIALNKVYTKILLKNYNINMVPSLYIKKKKDSFVIINDDFEEDENILDNVKKKFGYPVFVKASNQGSSVGCYKVESEDELYNKLKMAGSYDDIILIEKAINAKELEVAVLGNEDVLVSNVGEILPHGEFYTYDSKYNDKESKVLIPANITDEESEYIRKTSKKIFKILDGHGLSRCDFFKDKDTGKIYFNEINTMPGFTNISMYPMLIENMGINGTELIERLISLALEK